MFYCNHNCDTFADVSLLMSVSGGPGMWAGVVAGKLRPSNDPSLQVAQSPSPPPHQQTGKPAPSPDFPLLGKHQPGNGALHISQSQPSFNLTSQSGGRTITSDKSQQRKSADNRRSSQPIDENTKVNFVIESEEEGEVSGSVSSSDTPPGSTLRGENNYRRKNGNQVTNNARRSEVVHNELRQERTGRRGSRGRSPQDIGYHSSDSHSSGPESGWNRDSNGRRANVSGKAWGRGQGKPRGRGRGHWNQYQRSWSDNQHRGSHLQGADEHAEYKRSQSGGHAYHRMDSKDSPGDNRGSHQHEKLGGNYRGPQSGNHAYQRVDSPSSPSDPRGSHHHENLGGNYRGSQSGGSHAYQRVDSPSSPSDHRGCHHRQHEYPPEYRWSQGGDARHQGPADRRYSDSSQRPPSGHRGNHNQYRANPEGGFPSSRRSSQPANIRSPSGNNEGAFYASGEQNGGVSYRTDWGKRSDTPTSMQEMSHDSNLYQGGNQRPRSSRGSRSPRGHHGSSQHSAVIHGGNARLKWKKKKGSNLD